MVRDSVIRPSRELELTNFSLLWTTILNMGKNCEPQHHCTKMRRCDLPCSKQNNVWPQREKT